MKKEKSCGGVITSQIDGITRFLIIRSVRGRIAFPKGHVEPGENELETAHREIFEETGVRVTFSEGFRESVYQITRKGNLKEVVYYLGKALETKTVPQLKEVSEVLWLTFDEAFMRLTRQTDREVLMKAVRFMEN